MSTADAVPTPDVEATKDTKDTKEKRGEKRSADAEVSPCFCGLCVYRPLARRSNCSLHMGHLGFSCISHWIFRFSNPLKSTTLRAEDLAVHFFVLFEDGGRFCVFRMVAVLCSGLNGGKNTVCIAALIQRETRRIDLWADLIGLCVSPWPNGKCGWLMAVLFPLGTPYTRPENC